MLKSKLLPIKTHSLKKTMIYVTALIFGAVIYFQTILIMNEPMNLWSDPLPIADCGIVLTGAPGRVREAFEYLGQKKIQKLIVSGVYKDSKLHEIFPYMSFYPEVRTEDIILEKKSETTFGNAQQSLALVQNLKCKDVVLITSQIHMSRAYRIFKATYPVSIEIKKLSLPNSKTERSLMDFFTEIVKSLFYYGLGLV
jgi:uncharacterized SAM-binding protein YcdF (DUF218 family)